MSDARQLSYQVDFRTRRGRHSTDVSWEDECREVITRSAPVPRIARLLALALRFEEQVKQKTFTDYAGIARAGAVTRPRMTQIMKLINLAPDIQEAILFASAIDGLNERNLRPVVKEIEWEKQRTLFRKMNAPLEERPT